MELNFTFEEVVYRYQDGNILEKNRYGDFVKMLHIDVKDFDSLSPRMKIEICKCSIQGYLQGISEGKRLKMYEIRKAIGAESSC